MRTSVTKLKSFEPSKTVLDKPLETKSTTASQTYIKPVATVKKETVYPPILTFRERMEKEKRTMLIKTALLKATGILVLFILAFAALYALYTHSYSMFL